MNLGQPFEHLCTRFLLARDSEEIKSVDKEGGDKGEGEGPPEARTHGNFAPPSVQSIFQRRQADIEKSGCKFKMLPATNYKIFG